MRQLVNAIISSGDLTTLNPPPPLYAHVRSIQAYEIMKSTYPEGAGGMRFS
jgi:hypothetical protein